MKPFVIGIAGGTASGKSTVSERVVAALGERCMLLTHDRYYHSLPETLRHDPLRYNFDHPDALDTDRLIADLDQLRRGEPANIPIYDFPNHRRAEEFERAEPREILVVEGILVLADERLRQRLDRSVFVAAPDDIRLSRRIRRDMASRGRSVEQVLAQYEKTVRPMHDHYVEPSRRHAGLVLDGTAALDGLVGQVLGLLP